MRDNVREALAGRQHLVEGFRRPSGLGVGLSLSAAVLVLVMGLSAVRRYQADAQLIIRANATPLAGRVVPPVQPKAEPPAASDPGNDHDVPANQLARAEVIPAPEARASGLDTKPAAKVEAPPRFGYDLEHGILPPPDSKPVY
jgi:hypothetical protein